MARVMSVVMAVFLIAPPVIAPTIGEGLVCLGWAAADDGRPPA